MGRHADAQRGRRTWRLSVPIIVVCLLLIGATILGLWWWRLKSPVDPIAANPVDAYAVVISSSPCTDPSGSTSVRISGTDPPVTASLDACGYTAGQTLPVQYLAGHPEQVRLAGTSVAGITGLAGRLLPIGILAAGVVAILATLALLLDPRRSRHAAAARRVTVSQLRAGDRYGASSGTPAFQVTPAREPSDVVPAAEPTHLLPSGFVMIDEHLFTHGGGESDGATPDADPDPR